MDVICRMYREADRQEWLRMRGELWPTVAGDDADADAWLQRPDAAVLVAAQGNSDGLLGFAEVGARPYADGCDTSPVAFLEGWYVESTARRFKIGTALVAAVEAWAIAHGYRELASDSLLDNHLSYQAHLAVGFTEVERCIRYRKGL